MKVFAATFLAALTVTAAAGASDDIPVVGLDKHGEAVQTVISRDRFMEKYVAATGLVHRQTLRTLEAAPLLKGKPGGWSLRAVSVGLGLGFDVGLGSVLSVSTTPRIRLVYSNRRDAPMP